MNNETLTDFAYYTITDWKNETVLSSYCLPICPLTFKPKIPSVLNNQKIVWNFGDNTQSTELTATKTYEYPGKYTVNLIIYDCANQARLASYSKEIAIYDFTTNTIQLSTASTNTFQVSAGELSQPILVTSFFSRYQDPTDIFYSISGSQTPNYFSLSANKFNHFIPSHCLFEKTYNTKLSGYELVEVDKVALTTNSLFARISGSSITYCREQDNDNVFCGTSGSCIIYYKDCYPSDLVTIKFFQDKNNVYYETVSGFSNVNYINPLYYTLSAKVLRNTFASRFSVTSNGLDNEGNTINSFDIDTNKFVGGKIAFVAKIKSSNDYSVKTFPQIALSSIDVKLCGTDYTNTFVSLVSSSTVPIVSLNYATSSYGGGYLRGYCQYSRDAVGLTNAYINVSGSCTDNYGQTYQLSGRSSVFNIWPVTKYSIYKQNEDFGMAEVYKSLRFQEILLDKNILFDDFLSTIVGTESGAFTDLGKTCYEKIVNFIQNNSDVDTAELPQLESMLEMIQARSANYSNTSTIPNLVRRAMSLLSIQKNRLFGYKNQFSQNLDNRGVIGGIYGTNLGSQLNTLQYQVTAGVPIVAYEKFSDVYTLINTLQPLSGGVTTQQYALSTYTADWGWPLVLPRQFSVQNFDKYYTFYSYTSAINATITGGVIDFDNTQTTLSYQTPLTALNESKGVAECILDNALYTGLELLT